METPGQVAAVLPGTPAERAGVRVHDEVVRAQASASAMIGSQWVPPPRHGDPIAVHDEVPASWVAVGPAAGADGGLGRLGQLLGEGAPRIEVSPPAGPPARTIACWNRSILAASSLWHACCAAVW
jgi:hypothetical protein